MQTIIPPLVLVGMQIAMSPALAQAPVEMLASLAGSWTFNRGAGQATGVATSGMAGMPLGGVVIPLPAHPPQKFSLSFDPAAGYATLNGEGQSMAMVSATPAELEAVSSALSSAEVEALVSKDRKPAPYGACAWDTLPIMVGANDYGLDTPARPGGPGRLAYLRLPRMTTTLRVMKDGSIREAQDRDIVAGPDKKCYTDPKPARRIDDTRMSLTMKFQSPTQVLGVLMFEGKQGKSLFSAMAPVTMSR